MDNDIELRWVVVFVSLHDYIGEGFFFLFCDWKYVYLLGCCEVNARKKLFCWEYYMAQTTLER